MRVGGSRTIVDLESRAKFEISVIAPSKAHSSFLRLREGLLFESAVPKLGNKRTSWSLSSLGSGYNQIMTVFESKYC